MCFILFSQYSFNVWNLDLQKAKIQILTMSIHLLAWNSLPVI